MVAARSCSVMTLFRPTAAIAGTRLGRVVVPAAGELCSAASSTESSVRHPTALCRDSISQVWNRVVNTAPLLPWEPVHVTDAFRESDPPPIWPQFHRGSKKRSAYMGPLRRIPASLVLPSSEGRAAPTRDGPASTLPALNFNPRLEDGNTGAGGSTEVWSLDRLATASATSVSTVIQNHIPGFARNRRRDRSTSRPYSGQSTRWRSAI